MPVEIAPIQQGDQPTPHVILAQVGDPVHVRDGADNQQGDAIAEEVRTEHSIRKANTFFFLSQSPCHLMFTT